MYQNPSSKRFQFTNYTKSDPGLFFPVVKSTQTEVPLSFGVLSFVLNLSKFHDYVSTNKGIMNSPRNIDQNSSKLIIIISLITGSLKFYKDGIDYTVVVLSLISNNCEFTI